MVMRIVYITIDINVFNIYSFLLFRSLSVVRTLSYFLKCFFLLLVCLHLFTIDSFEIQELCYTTLENSCLPIHNTDITASLAIVLNGTACLTRFHRPCAGSSSKPKYPLITEWFIDMLKHYPRQTSDTLNCYIKAILTDSDITANKDLLSRYLDICAQYDAAMVRICGQSICGFLEQLALSKESSHRSNCVELISRMLVMNTKCDWELFRSELPKIPREISLLKILLQKIYDSNNVVAMKAINAFLKVVNDGNLLCKEIIRVRKKKKNFFFTKVKIDHVCNIVCYRNAFMNHQMKLKSMNSVNWII